MRLAALVSGGKDSLLAMCLAAQLGGHEIVAVCNLFPSATAVPGGSSSTRAVDVPVDNKDDLDSHCFQTVGHQHIPELCECLGLPLFRRAIRHHTSLRTQLTYRPSDHRSEKEEGDGARAVDEVEELYSLLKDTMAACAARNGGDGAAAGASLQGVVSGAILSNYQRLRVENVCSRLGLTSVAPLWQLSGETVLGLLRRLRFEAITIKVASMGLVPARHLGKDIAGQLLPHMLSLRPHIHPAGEGGEFESFTLNAPGLMRGGGRLRVRPASLQVRVEASSGSNVGVLHFDVDREVKTADVLAEESTAVSRFCDHSDFALRPPWCPAARTLHRLVVDSYDGPLPITRGSTTPAALHPPAPSPPPPLVAGDEGNDNSSSGDVGVLYSEWLTPSLASPSTEAVSFKEEVSDDSRRCRRREGARWRSIAHFNDELEAHGVLTAVAADELRDLRPVGNPSPAAVGTPHPAADSIEEQVETILMAVLPRLRDRLFYTVVFVSSIAKTFAAVNRVYQRVFRADPPCRALLQPLRWLGESTTGGRDDSTTRHDCDVVISLALAPPSGVALPPQSTRQEDDEVVDLGFRRPLHVQSISRWAAACIGPYAQANHVVLTSSTVADGEGTAVASARRPSPPLSHCTVTAGALGLDPWTMTLADRREHLGKYDTAVTGGAAMTSTRLLRYLSAVGDGSGGADGEGTAVASARRPSPPLSHCTVTAGALGLDPWTMTLADRREHLGKYDTAVTGGAAMTSTRLLRYLSAVGDGSGGACDAKGAAAAEGWDTAGSASSCTPQREAFYLQSLACAFNLLQVLREMSPLVVRDDEDAACQDDEQVLRTLEVTFTLFLAPEVVCDDAKSRVGVLASWLRALDAAAATITDSSTASARPELPDVDDTDADDSHNGGRGESASEEHSDDDDAGMSLLTRRGVSGLSSQAMASKKNGRGRPPRRQGPTGSNFASLLMTMPVARGASKVGGVRFTFLPVGRLPRDALIEVIAAVVVRLQPTSSALRAVEGGATDVVQPHFLRRVIDAGWR